MGVLRELLQSQSLEFARYAGAVLVPVEVRRKSRLTILAMLLPLVSNLRIGQTGGSLHSKGSQDLICRFCEGVVHVLERELSSALRDWKSREEGEVR